MYFKEPFELSELFQPKLSFQGVDDFFNVWLVFLLESEDDIVYEKEIKDIFFINYIQLLKDFLKSLVF